MTNQQFQAVLDNRIALIRLTLENKAKEYATDDRLHNFRKAAALRGTTLAQALMGMQIKHLVSVIDMVDSGKKYPQSLWSEKLGDAINYFILLEAIVSECQPPIQS
jgi:hypothetical protein